MSYTPPLPRPTLVPYVNTRGEFEVRPPQLWVLVRITLRLLDGRCVHRAAWVEQRAATHYDLLPQLLAIAGPLDKRYPQRVSTYVQLHDALYDPATWTPVTAFELAAEALRHRQAHA